MDGGVVSTAPRKSEEVISPSNPPFVCNSTISSGLLPAIAARIGAMAASRHTSWTSAPE